MIEIEINGLVHLIQVAESVADALLDDRQAMEEIGQVGRQSTADNFFEGGRPPWEALSPYTIARREREGIYGTDPLLATGETMQSFILGGNLYTLFNFSDHFVEWGNTREDFPFHDQGSRTEPQRQVLKHQEEDITHYTEIYVDFLRLAMEV